MLAALQVQEADILHSVRDGAAFEDIVGALKGRYGDHKLTAAYKVQLKARIQLNSESLQEFSAAVEQLVQRALV